MEPFRDASHRAEIPHRSRVRFQYLGWELMNLCAMFLECVCGWWQWEGSYLIKNLKHFCSSKKNTKINFSVHVCFYFFSFMIITSLLIGTFSLQSYFGLQKSTTLDGIKTQVNLAVEDPAKFKSAKLEVSGVEGKKMSAHKLKHRDMNILTPSGFWHRHPLSFFSFLIPLLRSLTHLQKPSHTLYTGQVIQPDFSEPTFLQCQISPNIQTC